MGVKQTYLSIDGNVAIDPERSLAEPKSRTAVSPDLMLANPV